MQQPQARIADARVALVAYLPLALVMGAFVAVALHAADLSLFLVLPAVAFLSLMKSQWRRAESRMLTWSPPVEPDVSRPTGDGLRYWLVAAVCAAFVAGWVTRSVLVFYGVCCALLFVGFWMVRRSERPRPRGGVTA